MGLWSFVKGNGKKLFGGGDGPALDGGALQDEIKELGLDAIGMEITVEGDTVKVSGEVISQEMKEKVILAVGKVSGVASVEEIFEANKPMLSHPDKIYPGQVSRIPQA